MEAAKAFAAQILSALNFQVDEIPVGEVRSADLRVSDRDSIYHIEVKTKFESETQFNDRVEILNRGDLFEQCDTLAHDNRISGILHDARKQLEETPKAARTFQLIWFHADGIDADLKYRQAFATFYGQVALVPLQPRSRETPTCFYFDYSAAFAMPTVDALIVSDSEQLQVCLNEFSPRLNEFRASALCREFVELGGVVDPLAMESAGLIIACRATVSRKNDDEIIEALRSQTGVLYSPIRLERHAVSATVIPPPHS
jgi:hypothetical protein